MSGGDSCLYHCCFTMVPPCRWCAEVLREGTHWDCEGCCRCIHSTCCDLPGHVVFHLKMLKKSCTTCRVCRSRTSENNSIQQECSGCVPGKNLVGRKWSSDSELGVIQGSSRCVRMKNSLRRNWSCDSDLVVIITTNEENTNTFVKYFGETLQDDKQKGKDKCDTTVSNNLFNEMEGDVLPDDNELSPSKNVLNRKVVGGFSFAMQSSSCEIISV